MTISSIASATFAIFLSLVAAIREQEAEIKPQLETYEITAYTAGYESTGKRPGDRGYGITASGKRVGKGDAACPPSMPFGTKLYIPEMDRTFTCYDRGGSIKGRRLDIYMASRSKAIEFGRRKMDVEIIAE